MPAKWFTEPVRAWWPDFRSDLCTPGHPLCILTASAIYADQRAERLERATERKYHFRRVEGRIGAPERIWTHLRTGAAPLGEEAAAQMVGCTVPQLYPMLHAALSARVLVCVRSGKANRFELGPVAPAGVAP